jgi:AsmA protein
MGRAARIAVVVVLAVLALAAALLAAVVLLVDPNDYRDRIAAAVRDATGRELVLGGPLALDVWPCCSLALADASLGNPAGFPAEPLVRVRAASLGLRLWPLLTARRVEVGRITLDGLDARLVTLADGRSNYDFANAAPDAAPDAAPSDGPPLTLDLAGILVRDGALTWVDGRDGTDYAVAGLSVETGAVRSGAAFPLTAALTLTDRSDGTVVEVALGGSATLDTAASRVALAGFTGQVGLQGPAVPTAAVGLAAQSATLDYAGDAVLAFVELSGTVEAAATGDLPGVRGEFGAMNAVVRSGAPTAVELPALRTLLTLTGPALPKDGVAVEANLQGVALTTDPVAGRVDRLAATLRVAGGSVELDGAGRFGDTTDLAGGFRIPGLVPRTLLAALDPEPVATADPKVLGALAGSGRWQYRDDGIALPALDLVLDDTRIRGSLGQSAETPARTRFDLTLDRINLDRYLAPDPAPAGDAAAAGADAPTALPLATLRGLRLDGRAQVGELRYAGLALAGTDVTVRADGGRVALDPLRTQLYGGSLAGSLGIDARGETARVTVRQTLRDVQLGGALADFADIRNVSGRVLAELDLAGSGNTDAAIKRDLDGRVSLALADGVYRGVDLWHEIRRGRALLRREAAPPAPADPATPLRAVELAGAVADGVLTTDRFLAEIPFLRLAGALRLDVPQEQLRGDLTASIFETPTFADGTSLPDLAGARLPLTLDGPLAGPKVRVDFTKMVREALKGTAREQLRSLQDRLLERLGGGSAPPAGSDAPADSAAPTDGEPAPAEPEPARKKPSSGDRVRGLLDQLLKPPPEE